MFENRQLRLHVPSLTGSEELIPYRMQGREGLSELFEYDVELLAQSDSFDPAKVLGQEMTIGLELPDQLGTGELTERYFHGYVASFGLVDWEGDFAVYRAQLRPHLWRLTRVINSRIYQRVTIPELVEQVLRKHGITNLERHFLGDHREKYLKREYCVQYRESDFNFLSRLLEFEGIHYFFRHERDRHVLVLTDSLSGHSEVPGYATIHYSRSPNPTHRRERIWNWRVTQSVVPETYTLCDYDFASDRRIFRSSRSIVPPEHLKSGDTDYEVYDQPEWIVAQQEYSPRTLEDYSRIRIEAYGSEYEIISADTDARGLNAGALFRRTDPGEYFMDEREFLVVSCLFRVASNAPSSLARERGDELKYHCSFRAIDRKHPFRPARLTPRPVVQGPQSATVVGQENQEIWTDQYGRVKLQFHWDRDGNYDENSSCWVRVAQLWAGNQWGAMHVPRIGQEVIVDFLEGDPDQPIVVGRVYNGSNPVPYKLPDNQTQSGIKSRSTKGGGPDNFNEIRFEDKKGQEELYIQAEKNHVVLVKNDQTSTIKANRAASVGGNDSVSVTGDRSVNVHGNLSVKVEGAGKSPIHSSLDVTGKHNLHASDTIEADAPTHIKLECGGSSILIEPGKITIQAGDGAKVVLDANALIEAAGKGNILVDANVLAKSNGGGQVLIDPNILATSAGGGQALIDATVQAQSAAGSALVLDGNATLSTPGDATVTGANSLVNGDSSAVLTGGGGTVEAAGSVTVQGTQVAVSGGTVDVTGGVVSIN